MILRRLRLLACTALTALAIATPAAADPISAAIVAIASSIGVTVTVAAVNSFLINAALSVGLSLLAKKSRGRGAGAGENQERQASVLTIQVGEVPREYVFGRACTAGSLVDGFNFGGSHGTDWECLVIALASHAVDALEGFWIYDTYYAFTASGMQAGFGNGLDIEFVNATAAGTPPPARFAGSVSGWASTDRCAGETIVWFAYSAKLVEARGGRPQPRFVLRGKKLYDPRKDSTVTGGSGAHRWATPSTWEWSENLALARYNWVRGIYAGDDVGSPEALWVGRGLSAVEAPPERIFAAANLCDEDVALKAGGTQKRYHGGGVVRADETYETTEDMFAEAMAGEVVQREGGVEIEPGAAKAVVMEITDADLVDGEMVSFEEFLSDPQRINTVAARYVEPAQRWNDHAAPVRRSITDITTDGRPKEEPLPLGFVTNGPHAQRCAEIRRRLNRLERRAGLTLGPRFAALEEGDWIGWTSDRYHQGARRVYRVERYGRAASWRKTLGLREISASVFTWTAADDEYTPGTTPPSDPPTLSALGLTGVTIQGVLKGGVPAVRIHYDTPVDPAIEGVRVEIRETGQAEVTPTMTRDLTGVLETTNGVPSSADIDVRLLPMAPPHREVATVAWTTITSDQLVAGRALELADQDGNPIDLDDIRNDQVTFSAKRTYGGFASMAPFTLSDLTASFPVNTSTVRLTPTGASPYLQINAVNRAGAESYVIRVRLKAAAAITAAQWDGTVLYSTPGHVVSNSYRKDIPFPPGGLPVGKWKLVEFDMSDLTAGGDDFIDSDIEQVRFYLAAAGGPAIDVDFLSFGTRGVDPLDLREVEDGATDGATTGHNLWRDDGVTGLSQADIRTIEGTAAFLDGEGLLARRDTVGTAHIEARAVKPTQLYSADRTNLFPDPDLGDDAVWTTVGTTAKLVTGLAFGSEYIRRLTDTATTNYFEMNPAYAIEVKPGQAMFFGMAAYINASDGSAQLSVRWYSDLAATVFISTDNIGSVTDSAAILRIGKTVMPPATARRCLLRVNRPPGGIGTANFGEIFVAYATQLGRQLAAEDGTPLDDVAVRTEKGRALGLKAAPTTNLSNGLAAALDAGGMLIDVEDGVPVVFTDAYPTAPKIMFLGHNLDAPDAATNEFQQLRALTPSGTGFTPSLKNAISSVTFTTRTNTTATTSMPAQQVEATKNQSGVAASGEKYLAKVVVRDRGDLAMAGGVPYTEPVSVTVSFYGRQTSGGPWVYGGSTTYTTAGSATSGGTRTVEIEGDFGFATWTIHANSEYKIVIESGYLAGKREITAFTSVVWKEATGGSITTATALSGGKKGKALIIPTAN